MILLGDEIFTKVGGYVLGNVLTSVIAGLGTTSGWSASASRTRRCSGLLVALLDLIPVVGSTIGGAIVTLVALTVSLPVAIATLASTWATGSPRTTWWCPGSWAARSRCPPW